MQQASLGSCLFLKKHTAKLVYTICLAVKYSEMNRTNIDGLLFMLSVFALRFLSVSLLNLDNLKH